MAAEVWYATVEQVKDAGDFAETARSNTKIAEELAASSRDAESLTHRVFYPTYATRYKAWPSLQTARSWRLWLDGDELVSLDTLTSGGTEIVAADYFLEPANTGPPYNRIEIDLSSTAGLSTGATAQRSVAMTGTFAGCRIDERAASATAEALDATETGVDVTDSSDIGVGTIIKVDTERMVVTGRTMVTTGQTTTGSLAAATNVVTVPVSDGTAFFGDETILVDSERMRIIDIAGNNLTVKRAWDGTVLAAHNTAATVYAPRSLTVERGALGTTAATHLTAATVYRYVPPALVTRFTIANTLVGLANRSAAYARVVGSGDNQREARGRALEQVRDQLYDAHARKVRMRGV
jgi:hypothetical protein